MEIASKRGMRLSKIWQPLKSILRENDAENGISQSQNETKRVWVLRETDDVKAVVLPSKRGMRLSKIWQSLKSILGEDDAENRISQSQNESKEYGF